MIHKKPLSLKNAASVRELRAFVAVYHTGNLSVAANQLSLSQPAVSMLLRGLEEKLGIRLFDRDTRSVRRTDASNEAIAHAEGALLQIERLADEMADLAGGRRGRVRIVATSSFAQTLLPPVIKRYVDAYPEVRFSLDDCAPREFVEAILSRRADFGVGTLETPLPELEEHILMTDTLCAAAQRGPRFRSSRALAWADLAKMPIIAVKGGYGVRRSIDAAARSAGVELHVAHEVSLLTTAIAMAGAGLGVAIVPGSMLKVANRDDLIGRPLVRPVVERRVAVVRRADSPLSRAGEHFVATLEAHLDRTRARSRASSSRREKVR